VEWYQYSVDTDSGQLVIMNKFFYGDKSSTDAPHQSFRLIRKLIPKHFQPWLRGLRKTLTRPSSLEEPYYSVYPYTQAALIRQQNLVRLAEDIDALDVPGAIIECGVLDGAPQH
jgi:hypothetical protein